MYAAPPITCSAPIAAAILSSLSMPFWRLSTPVVSWSSGARLRGRSSGVVRLHAEEDDVDGADLGGFVRRPEAVRDRPLRLDDRKAVRAERLEVAAAGDQRDVGAAVGEPRAVVRADRAGAEHRDPEGHATSRQRHATRSNAAATEPPPPRQSVASP